MILVTLDCGLEVGFDDGRKEVEKIDACPDCSNLIRERIAAAPDADAWDHIRATFDACRYSN